MSTDRNISHACAEVDQFFSLLQNERRLRTVEYLAEQPQTSLRELSKTIAAPENNCTKEALSSAEYKRVYISLLQTHLPQMDDAEVLRFTSENNIEANPAVVGRYQRVLEAVRAELADDRGDRDEQTDDGGSLVGTLVGRVTGR